MSQEIAVIRYSETCETFNQCSSASHTAHHLFRTITETKGFSDQSDHWLSCKTYWSAVNVLHSVLVIKCHASIGMSLHIKASWQERYKRIIDDLPRTNSAQSCSLCCVCVWCVSCCRSFFSLLHEQGKSLTERQWCCMEVLNLDLPSKEFFSFFGYSSWIVDTTELNLIVLDISKWKLKIKFGGGTWNKVAI